MSMPTKASNAKTPNLLGSVHDASGFYDGPRNDGSVKRQPLQKPADTGIAAPD